MDRYTAKPQTVIEAKQQLRAVTRQTDYLTPVKNHPVASIGAAFMAGMLLQKAGKGGLPPGLLSVGLQLLKKL
uniref:Uncharacterized protein n=1 Tax=uncultured Thiotrichaceae bacterium TaxID=298394 RepID=A0A6S6UA41_9GAMM|nr:MAG: Unknown protein [uncultured Thiotrichaceae bacterium]